MELFNMLGKISQKDFLKIREPKRDTLRKKKPTVDGAMNKYKKGQITEFFKNQKLGCLR